jgi:hypothetical protein
MRKTLALASLGVAVTTALLPATPASAYCDVVTSAVLGGCSNPCTVVARAYYTADDLARDLLPDVQFICLA